MKGSPMGLMKGSFLDTYALRHALCAWRLSI
jgi:hypothetical protein